MYKMEPLERLNFEHTCSRSVNASVYNEEDLQEWFYTTGETILVAVLLSIISFSGILGNCALVAVIVFVPDMHTTMNIYLANLACIDLLYCACTFFDHLWTYLASDGLVFAEPYRTAGACAVIKSLVHLSLFISMGIISLVSLERFLAVCCPLKHQYMASKNRTIKLLVFVWISAIIITGIVAPAYSHLLELCLIWPSTDGFKTLPTTVYQCGSITPSYSQVHRAGENIFFILILSTSTVWYGRMIAHLSRRVINNDIRQLRSPANALKTRNQVALMVIVNGLVFFCCLFPYQFYNFYMYMGFAWLTHRQCLTFLWIARLFGGLNSALNPIIYTAINSSYRKAFMQVFCRGQQSNTRPTELVGWASRSRLAGEPEPAADADDTDV